MKKIIINIGTHGDEKIGSHVVAILNKNPKLKGLFTVITANEKASLLNVRYIDQDLNRSFPGKKKGNYEEQRAHELMPLITSADLVIDIHSTTSELKDALIVTKLNKNTREYIDVISPKFVLLMKATKNTALISHTKIGIAFEYGKDNDTKIIQKIANKITTLLTHIHKKQIIQKKDRAQKTIFFEVQKTVDKPHGAILNKKIKNYLLVKKGQTIATIDTKKIIAKNDFYPILFGQKNYDDMFGFAAKKIT